VMANDMAAAIGGASGYLEMNVYKPLLIFNITKSIRLMTDGCANFRKFLVEGTEPNFKQINHFVERSLMLVTALSPVIGYDQASKVAHYALDHDLTLNKATAYTEAERQALGLVGLVPDVTESEDLQLRRVLRQLDTKTTDL